MFLIIGFTNRTSFSLSQYLLNQNHQIIISDQKNTSQQQELIQKLPNQDLITNKLGIQEDSLLEQYPIQKIFLSPGVPRSIPIIQKAIKLGIEILNDIEYFYQLFPNRTYIGITGTDGKTTVTTWLGNLIQREKSCVLVGNIGTPIFEYADDKYSNHIFLVELSSFQLESLNHFHAHISIITNIHDDHIDRYHSKDHYAWTKKNIFNNQTKSDFAILNHDNEYTSQFSSSINSQIKLFAFNQGNCYFKNNTFFYENESVYSLELLSLKGKHNLLNALIVILVGKLLKLSEDAIINSLKEFQGVPHRLQYIGNKKGIEIYNDSKATTPQAVQSALESFDKPVILLAGGCSKQIDFSPLTQIVQSKTKKIFYFGELAQELSQIWGGTNIFPTMYDAVIQALKESQFGDILLLSPGGTSFDEYSSYSERGEDFCRIIENYFLNENNSSV